MKIAIANHSGNVGKTTLASNLFVPRLKNCQVVRIETINSSDDVEVDAEIAGTQFNELMSDVLQADESANIVADIGASNIETVMRHIENRRELADMLFDAWIIPVTMQDKQQRDTIATVVSLLQKEIDPAKILVVANIVPSMSEMSVFTETRATVEAMKVRFLAVPVLQYDVIPEAKELGLDISALAQMDTKKIRSDLVAEPTKEGKARQTALIMAVAAAKVANENLNHVWNEMALPA